MPELATWVGFWGGLAGLIQIIGWRERARHYGELGAVTIFVAIDRLDRLIFGDHLVSVRAIVSTFVFTGIMTGFLTMLFVCSWNEYIDWWPGTRFVRRYCGVDINAFFVPILYTNLLPDAFSVWATRYFLRIVKQTSTGHRRTFILVALDLIAAVAIASLTALIFVDLILLLFYYLVQLVDNFGYNGYDFFYNIDYLSLTDIISVKVVSFISAFSTSFWLWVYIIGWFIASVIEKLSGWLLRDGVLTPLSVACAFIGIFGVPFIIL